jgi:hypothetical protein
MAQLPQLGPATSQLQILPKGWDKLTLGGVVMPGHARVTRGSIRTRIDRKNVKGVHGASPTLSGLEPQPLEVEITTYSDADREALLVVLSKLPLPGRVGPPPKGKTDPNLITIDHASLRGLRINMVIIISASALIVQPGTSIANMTFELLHAFPKKQKSATSTPNGTPLRTGFGNVRGLPNPLPTEQAGFALPKGFELQLGIKPIG